jgi:hypothetical protein
MAAETFSDNLLRAIGAELHLQSGLSMAREMFGKSYFALGVAEKATVDQTVLTMLAANFQWLTPENLAAQKQQNTVGFVPPTPEKK